MNKQYVEGVQMEKCLLDKSNITMSLVELKTTSLLFKEQRQ